MTMGYYCTLLKSGQKQARILVLFFGVKNGISASIACHLMYICWNPFFTIVDKSQEPNSLLNLDTIVLQKFSLVLTMYLQSSGKSEKWVMRLSLTHFKVKCYVLLLNLFGFLKIFHVVVAITYSSFSGSQRSINRWNAWLSHLNGVLGLF